MKSIRGKTRSKKSRATVPLTLAAVNAKMKSDSKCSVKEPVTKFQKRKSVMKHGYIFF
jgi:hypothetical protein